MRLPSPYIGCSTFKCRCDLFYVYMAGLHNGTLFGTVLLPTYNPIHIVLKTVQFLNHCRNRINPIKQQKLALPIYPSLESYNCKPSSSRLAFCNTSIYNFCIYSFVRHEQMQQFAQIEYRCGLSKLRRFRKVWIECYYITRLLVICSMYAYFNQSYTRLFMLSFRTCMTRFGILFFKHDVTSCLWSAEFAVSTDVRCKSPE